MTIVVCWKWVSLDGDARWAGVSHADRAALESALVLAEGTVDEVAGDEVVVVALGPADADFVLREAIAAGASRGIRIDAPADLRSDAVARALAGVIATTVERPSWILCGDYSLDRGSGSVPAVLAAELGAAQALGLVEIDTGNIQTGNIQTGNIQTGSIDAGESGRLAVRAVRRLDGGRREVLSIAAPAVLSVEGSVARLRRAPLSAGLAARNAPITVVPGPSTPRDTPSEVRPYRPRARVLAPPPGDDALARVRAITAADASVSHGETVTLEPAEAAARIVQALRDWGYLETSAP
jgi:electron transfer flavoprotein beta subunit